MNGKKIILIAGPTAVGKTAMAVRAAEHFHTSIISADSRQCFRELSIGVAKPSVEQLQQVKHYFIDSHSVSEEVSAGMFEQLALDWVGHIFDSTDVAVLTGGTGLYIKAFLEGLDDMPQITASAKTQVLAGYETGGIAWLQGQVRTEDPAFYSSGEILNPRRLMRALEVKLSTGRSILSFRKNGVKPRPFETIKIGLHLPKERLITQINARVDHMMEMGFLQEVQGLGDFRKRHVLRTVGYRELFSYLDGKISLDEAVAQIKTNTWRYAKRQYTWFRKDSQIRWIAPDNWGELVKITEA